MTRTRNHPAHKKSLDVVFCIISPHGEQLHEPDYQELNPVGGSEASALWMAQTLRTLGHNARIVTDYTLLAGLTCDVFIAVRAWQIFQAGYYPGKVNYLWCTDNADQQLVEGLRKPEIALPIYNRLNGLFLLSTYQQIQWINNLNLVVEKIIPTTNGIPLEKFHVNTATLRQRQPWSYYASTPFRGLQLLLLAWPTILKAVPGAQLHLFTSMKIYKVDETDEYRQMYDTARQLPGIIYHGSVGQAELRDTAKKCRALAYPCIFPETSCITAMEAMASGCAIVGSGTGALMETAWHNPLITPGDNWLPIWANALIKVLTNDDEYERLALQNLTIAKYYDWSLIAHQWLDKFMEDLSAK